MAIRARPHIVSLLFLLQDNSTDYLAILEKAWEYEFDNTKS